MKKTISVLLLLLLFGVSHAPAQNNTTRTNAAQINPDLLPNLANLTNQTDQTDQTNQASQTNRANRASRPAVALPFQVVVVQTPEKKESSDLAKKARAFLSSKDYDGLDGFVDGLRSSKAAWATGRWKLSDAYFGLIPAKDASDQEWVGCLAALRRWVAARPESISARVALADLLTDYAWKARGAGSSGSVTEEGWQLFRERLDESMSVLNEAGYLKAKCPELWVVKLRTALGLQYEKAQFNAIFDEAVRFAPDFESLYSQRAIYLLPRWYGSQGEWESALMQSADRLGGRDGDELYARIVWAVDIYGSSNVFKENDLSWARVDRGFEVILEHFPDSLAAISERAKLASLAGDRQEARQYFDKTEGKVDLSVWQSRDHFVRFANWAYWRR